MNDETPFDASDDAFNRRLKAIEAPRPPEGLLARCLKTIDAAADAPIATTAATSSPRPARRWAFRAAAIVAGVVIVISGFWISSGERNVLAEVYRAMDQSPAYHIHWTTERPGVAPGRAASNDMWVVAGSGSRQESQIGGKLVSVVVDNSRWRLIWDVPANEIIAWPSNLVPSSGGSPFQNGPFGDRDRLIRWAESHKKSIARQQDTLDGRIVDKLTFDLHDNQQTETLWFDRDTRRPLKYRSADSKTHAATEATIDYPSAASIPAERFAPTLPRDAKLEINDPAFGRQIHSTGAGGLDLRQP
jgi:hypothetical protein